MSRTTQGIFLFAVLLLLAAVIFQTAVAAGGGAAVMLVGLIYAYVVAKRDIERAKSAAPGELDAA